MKQTETLSSMSEAPASINFRVTTAKGYDLMVTLRSDVSEVDLLERFKNFVGVLEDHGATAVGRTTAPPAVTAPNGVPPTTPAQVVATESETETFAASSLVCSINDGKTYFKIQGGPFTKFGVTVWSEVIGTIFDLDQLDPTQTYDLTGYTATYLRVDGKPKKVTALIKT